MSPAQRQSQQWLVRMQTAVKEGVNVETGTRKVSMTTDLVRHSNAGPGARAVIPVYGIYFPMYAIFPCAARK
jgi:hypothetical protein